MAEHDPILVDLEVPLEWFGNPLDGAVHRQMFATLAGALAARPVSVRMTRVPFGSWNVPRAAPPGGVMLSYHSVGDAPNVWRIKETSIQGYYSFDPRGYSGWSSLSVEPDAHRAAVAAMDTEAARARVAVLKARLRAANASKYAQSEERFSAPRPYVFFPLQLLDDPVSAFARIPHLDVLRAAAEQAAASGRTLVVKRHPYCRSPAVELAITEIRDRHRAAVHLTNASVHALIDGASAVLVANSGVGMEALLYEKPVFSFAASEYDIASRPVRALDDVAAAFADPAPDDGAAVRFLAYYLDRCCFDITRVETAERCIDRALAPLAGAAVAGPSGARTAEARLLETGAALEATRRELLKARQESEALQRAALEAVSTANQLAEQLRAARAAPGGAEPGILRDVANTLFLRARASAESEHALSMTSRDGYAAFARLADAWRGQDSSGDALAAELLRSEYAAAADPKVAHRNVKAEDYQALHDKDANYQANNWLMEHIETLKRGNFASVAEIGCGNGRFLKAFAPFAERILALDWARSPLLDPLPPNVEFRRTDLMAPDPLPEAALYCSADVLEHFRPETLPGLVERLHRAGATNYHVIACYDDTHSHLAVFHPGQWLSLFQAHDPAYRLTAVAPRPGETLRGGPNKVVAVVTNMAGIEVNRPAPHAACGVFEMPNGIWMTIQAGRVCLIDGKPVADWVALNADSIVVRWRGDQMLDYVRRAPDGRGLEFIRVTGEMWLANRLN